MLVLGSPPGMRVRDESVSSQSLSVAHRFWGNTFIRVNILKHCMKSNTKFVRIFKLRLRCQRNFVRVECRFGPYSPGYLLALSSEGLSSSNAGDLQK